jgi:hypothetical protein
MPRHSLVGPSVALHAQTRMRHPALEETMRAPLEMERKVHEKALERLSIERLENDPQIVAADGRFYGNPLAFAMNEFMFFKCARCAEPYFGGANACEDAAVVVDPAILVCGPCQRVDSVSECPKHGNDFLAFKCRFCCSLATFHCWEKVRFCTPCHNDWNANVEYQGANKKKLWEYKQCAGLKAKMKPIVDDESLSEEQKVALVSQMNADPQTCPLYARHLPNGIEFGMGCTMCTEEEKRAALDAATAAAAAAEAARKAK